MRKIVLLIVIFATLAACTPLAQGQVVTNNDQLELNTVYFSTRSEDSGDVNGFKRSGPNFAGNNAQAGTVPGDASRIGWVWFDSSSNSLHVGYNPAGTPTILPPRNITVILTFATNIQDSFTGAVTYNMTRTSAPSTSGYHGYSASVTLSPLAIRRYYRAEMYVGTDTTTLLPVNDYINLHESQAAFTAGVRDTRQPQNLNPDYSFGYSATGGTQITNRDVRYAEFRGTANYVEINQSVTTATNIRITLRYNGINHNLTGLYNSGTEWRRYNITGATTTMNVGRVFILTYSDSAGNLLDIAPTDALPPVPSSANLEGHQFRITAGALTTIGTGYNASGNPLETSPAGSISFGASSVLALISYTTRQRMDFYFLDSRYDMDLQLVIQQQGQTSTTTVALARQGHTLTSTNAPKHTCLLYTSPSPRD